MEMIFQTALLDIRQMDEVDRLTVACGKTATELKENAGSSVPILEDSLFFKLAPS